MKRNLQISIIALAFSTGVYAEVNTKKFVKELKSGVAESVLSDYVKIHKDDVNDIVTLVKKAIVETEADSAQVGRMVDQAIKAAPEHARMIQQAALAVAPDAHDEIHLAYTKHTDSSVVLGSNAKGETVAKAGLSNAKGGKGAKDQVINIVDEATVPNPLDFPTATVSGLGVNPGSQGGQPLLPFGPSPTSGQPTIPPSPVSRF